MTTLTATPLVPDGGGLDVTALLAAPGSTTLTFNNTGQQILAVSAGASSETVTVDIGALVEGETVSNFPAVTLVSGHLSLFGPFHTVDDVSGSTTMQVTLSTTTNITVALLQTVGVF